MLDILVPSIEATRLLQKIEQRYYWSRCAEAVFRREGVISVRRRTEAPQAASLTVACRGVDADVIADLTRPLVIEGPLSPSWLERLGLKAQPLCRDSLSLTLAGRDASEGRRQHDIFFPQILARGPDKAPYPYQPHDPLWQGTTIVGQELSGEGWTPVAEAQDPSGASHTVALVRGPLLVIGLPLFDVLGRWLAVPPLDARYGGFERLMAHAALGRELVEMILAHGTRCGAPPQVQVAAWPAGRRAALTIRHDYDRATPVEGLASLLETYDDVSLKASIGLLPYLLEQPVINLFRERGHEIQAHVASPDRATLREDMYELGRAAAASVVGLTVHGGPNGIGFRGQTHFEWFDDLGLEYCETFGVRDTIPSPICRLYDGVPGIAGLLATPGHLSMDRSTRPEDHCLDSLLRSVPKSLAQGNHVIIMNHPDVHRDQMKALARQLPLDDVWKTTTREAVAWHRITRYDALADRQEGGYAVTFGGPLPEPLIIQAGEGPPVPVPRGACSTFLPEAPCDFFAKDDR